MGRAGACPVALLFVGQRKDSCRTRSACHTGELPGISLVHLLPVKQPAAWDIPTLLMLLLIKLKIPFQVKKFTSIFKDSVFCMWVSDTMS